MDFKLILLAAFMVTCVKGWAVCNDKDYCKKLRSRDPTQQYALLSITPLESEDGSVYFEFQEIHDDKKNYKLILNALKNGQFRIQLEELNSTRYKIIDVLDGEPDVIKFTNLNPKTDYCILENGKQVLNVSKNLDIELINDGETELIFKGNRLSFDPDSSAFSFGVTFNKAKVAYGLAEHADRLSLQETSIDGADPYRLFNVDYAAWDINSTRSCYGAIPVLYGHGKDFTSGVFLHNAAEQWIEITHKDDSVDALFMVYGGALDLFILPGPKPVDVVRRYTELTGRAHMPQLWTLGYHQCRYSYKDQEDTKEVIAMLDQSDFPVDAIWLDIDYTDDKKYFTWNPETFSDPEQMQANLSAAYKKLVTIIDPHIKVEQGYIVYDEANEKGYFVKNNNGSNFEGECWPGLSSYIDFLNPDAREFIGSMYSYENFAKSTPTLGGIWNDMNEPSVFNSSENTMPLDNLHYGGVQHGEIHNMYGLLHTKSTHQGLMARDKNQVRPFILTRSHFAGSQRYAAFWNGDSGADWPYLVVSVAQCLNANILGLPFCGGDIGGFIGDPENELVMRWYQAAAWTPFYRAHADSGSQRREPYLYDSLTQEVIRNAMKLRYMHIPIWYTLFYEYVRTGEPVIRPLFYQYPEDLNVLEIDDHILVGTDILVRPIMWKGVNSISVYFPGGENEHWFANNGDSFHAYQGIGWQELEVDINSVPLFYRAGSIIVRKETSRPSTALMIYDRLTVYVYCNADGKATGRLYIDDYTSFNYTDKKQYSFLEFTGDLSTKQVKYSQVDSDNEVLDEFFITIGNVWFAKLSSHQLPGEPLTYEMKSFTHTSDGTLLKDIKFNLNKPFTIQF